MKNLSWYDEDYWDEEDSFQKISHKAKTVKRNKETTIRQRRKERMKMKEMEMERD